MKLFKRTLSVILSFILSVSMLPVTGLADDGRQQCNHTDTNKFCVEYDDRGGDSDVSVKANNTVVKSGNYTDFTTDTAISFELNPPQDRQGQTPIVEIEVYGGNNQDGENIYRSDLTDSNKIEISDNKFSFTPKSQNHFIVRVWWSEYDALGGYCTVEFETEGNGTVNIQEPQNNNGNLKTFGNRTKICWEEENTVPSSVTFSIAPSGDGNKLEAIYVEQDNNNNINLETDSRYSSQNNTFTLDLSDDKYKEEWGGKFVNIRFCFTGSNPQGGGGNPPPQSQENTVDFNNTKIENGSYTVKDGDTTKGTVSVKLNDASITTDEQNNIAMTSNDKLVIKLTPAEGYNAVLRTGGDSGINADAHKTTGSDGEIIYTFAFSDLFNDSGNHVSFNPDFENQSGGEEDIDWYTVSYGSSANVGTEHGQVYAERIHHGDTTYTSIDSEVNESKKIYSLKDTIFKQKDEQNQNEEDTLTKYGISGSDGDIFIKKDTQGDISIDFKFIPDFGYQLKDIYTNEDNKNTLLNDFAPDASTVSKFKFDVKAGENVHFKVDFEKADNTVSGNASAGTSISSENAAQSGTLAMNVEQAEADNIPTGSQSVAAYDITLKNIVSKGGNNGNWENPITDLGNDKSATVTLPVSDLDTENYDYFVIREHGEEKTELPVTASNGTISFDTNKFSKYIIVKKAKPQGGSTSGGAGSYTPPETKPETQPTVTENADGSITSTITSIGNNGNTTSVSTTKDTSGNIINKVETTTEKNADGSTVEKKIVTDADKNVISTTTTTEKDNSKTVVEEKTNVNDFGNTVEQKLTQKYNPEGKLTGSEKTAVIGCEKSENNIESAFVSIKKDASDAIVNAEAVVSSAGTQTSAGNVRYTLSNALLSQLTAAAGQDAVQDMNIIIDGSSSTGKISGRISADTADLISGKDLILVMNNTPAALSSVYNGKSSYTLVNSKIYSMKSGNAVSVVLSQSGDYTLVNEDNAEKIVKKIKSTIKAQKSKVSVKKGKSAYIRLSDKLNMNNVRKIKYTSGSSKVSVSSLGKIYAKKRGNSTVYATVFLKNGDSKKVSVKVTVK